MQAQKEASYNRAELYQLIAFLMLKFISGQFSVNKKGYLSFVETLTHNESSARVIFALEIEEDGAQEYFNKMKKIFQDDFFEDEKEVLLRFEECMKKLNESLKENTKEIHGIISVQDKSELHVSQTGQGETYLIRRGKLNVIIENMNNPVEGSDETFTSIASGELLVDDKVVFSSLRILRYATASQVVSVLSEGISEGIESLKELLELETEGAAVMCLHSRGESVFAHTEKKASLKIPRHIRGSMFKNMADSFDSIVENLAQRTGKSAEVVQNSVFAAVGIIFAVLIVWGVSSASVDNTQKEKYEAYKTQMLKIEKELQTAETRALMNDLSSSNAILDKVESGVQEMLQAGVFTDEALAIIARVQKQRDDANKITRIKDMESRTLADISSVATEEKVKGVSVLNDEVFAYTQSTLYKSVLDHIEPGITVNEESEIVRADAMDDRGSIIFTLSSGQYLNFSEGLIAPATTTDSEGFKNGVSHKGYSRFMYLLSPQDNQIWKYEKKREGFTVPSPWLASGEDVSGALDLAIDGSVYVLKEGGGVSLFHKGKEVALAVTGGNPDLLKDVTRIFVKLDMVHVYFFNPVKNSIVSFEIERNGLKYNREYIFETETPIVDFYIDKNEQRMILADDKKLYEITL